MTVSAHALWAGALREPAGTVAVPLQPPSIGYTLKNALGDLVFEEPVVITSPPGETNRLFIVERKGTIQVITNLAQPSKTLFLDLRSGTYADYEEAGLLGMAFHPGYATNGYFYIYRTRFRSGLNGLSYGLYDQLSRLRVSSENPNAALKSSEVDFIVQLDQSEEHNAGDIQFGPDGYLYLSLGDNGPPQSDFAITRQPIDKGLFGGILRIDVDRRPNSLPPNPHPSVTGNYAIPPDNPWIGTTEYQGQPIDPRAVRTEFYAIGFRNPWRISFDPETGLLYCGDVGGNEIEEVDLVTSGANYGWPYREGTMATTWASQAPPSLSAAEPLYSYQHGYGTNQGRAIIGGRVYRGTAIPQLVGAYIFSDNISGHVWSLRHSGSEVTEFLRLTGNSGVSTFGVDPRNGDILLANTVDGRIRRLVYIPPEQAEPFPMTLADTGIFSDVEHLIPAQGVVPYEINVPFWSDNAIKSRWFTIPDPSQKIGYRAAVNLYFPEGTVWIKHFELELTNGVASSRRRLETRLLVKNETGVYGVTYRWGDSTTNAFLLPNHGGDEVFQVYDQGTVRTQVWHYPTRNECILCHSAAGGLALGFNTFQLNRKLANGNSSNQLELLRAAGYFNDLPELSTLKALANATNATAPLEERARSYLAVNCSQCHYPSTWTGASWDARFTTPMLEANIIRGHSFDTPEGLVVPRDADNSVLFRKLSAPGFGRMPPIGSTVPDTNGFNLIRQWIDTLPNGSWSNRDIGDIQRFGSASISNEVYRVSGSGLGIGTTADSFHFLYERLENNGQISVRLDESSSLFNSQAGLMLRQNLNTNAAQAALVAGSGTLRFIVRGQSGAAASVTGFPRAAGPVWLRLVREDTKVSAWTSADGIDWIPLSTVLLTFEGPLYIGMVAAAGNTQDINNAAFSDPVTTEISLQVGLSSYSVAPARVQLQAVVPTPTTNVARVAFYSGELEIGSVEQPPYEMTWTNVGAGLHRIQAYAFDRRGAPVASTPFDLLITSPSTGVEFLREDQRTRGNWLSIYGLSGYALPLQGTNLPWYVTWQNGEPDVLAWPNLDRDVSALQQSSGKNRRAGAWVHASPWILQVDLNDGLWHQLSLYFWGGEGGRTQLVELMAPESDTVLDAQTLQGLTIGEYLTWTVRGSVRIRITAQAGSAAILAGLFLDSFQSDPVPVELTSPLPGTFPGPTNLWLRAEPLGDPALIRSVEFFDNGEMIAEDTEWPFEFFWANPWVGSHELLARSITHFDVAAVSAPVQIDFTEPDSYAVYMGENPSTGGAWKGIYGQQGYLIAGHATNLPAFAEVKLDYDHVFLEGDDVLDWRALQHVNDPYRITASYVDSRAINIVVNLRDGLPHLLALYIMESGPDSRTLSLNVNNARNGAFLDRQEATHLSTGHYYAWAVRGHIHLEISLEAGGNAVLSGLFLGTPLEHWRTLRFTQSELGQPSISADRADADHDGLPTLVEYLIGSNPKDPQQASFSFRIQQDQLLMEFDQPNYTCDVRLLVEASPNLIDWSAYPVEELQRIDRDTYQHVQLRANIPSAGGSPLFFRWGAQRQ